MPVYDYTCPDCGAKFDALRSMSQADAPIACPKCGGQNPRRSISVFAAISKGSGGETHAVSGTGPSCASCSALSCDTCGH